MNIIPLGNRVIILPDPKKEETSGGLIIPGAAQRHEGKGKVISVSPDIAEPQIKPDDHVMYNVGSARPVEDAGTTYHFVPIEDIMARI